MTSFFTFAVNETTSGSVYYLGSIFGIVGQVLPGTGPAVLGAMFKVFNTAVLAIGTMIISYTTGMSIILTAHEGEMLGKKFHALWVPLRTVMGISALVPTSTGYSYLQIALMWFILQGVGAADTLWQATINYVAASGSLAPPPPGAGQTNPNTVLVREHLQTLFKGLACQAAQKATGITTPGAGYLCQTTPSSWCSKSDTDMLNVSLSVGSAAGNVYQMGTPPGACGTLQLLSSTNSAPNSPNTLALVNAYQLIVPVLGGIAAQLVAMDDAYSSFVSTTSLAMSPPPTPSSLIQGLCNTVKPTSVTPCTPAAFNGAMGQAGPTTSTNISTDNNIVKAVYWPYMSQLLGANSDFLTTQAIIFQGIMTNAVANAATTTANTPYAGVTDNGWIFAGAYFYRLAQNTNAATNSETPAVSVPTPPAGQAQTSLAMSEADFLVNSIPSTTTSVPGQINIGSCSLLGFISLGGVCNSVFQYWMSSLAGSTGGGVGNPIVSGQNFGAFLLDVVETSVEAISAALIILGATGTLVLGTGNAVIPLVIEVLILPIFFFFAAAFVGIGGTLAVYTPLVPFMLFAFGAINWIIAVIETMIAAPIIAIGLLYPEGAHELWGKAEAAINLLLNIFLRPSLMIFGMIAALLMSYVAMTLVNNSFILTVNQLVNGGTISVMESLFFMIVYTSIFATVINKCFELIHIIPDKILRWIGGGAEQFGGDSGAALGNVSKGFQEGSQKVEGAVSGAQAAKGMTKGSDKKEGKGPSAQAGGDAQSKSTATPPSSSASSPPPIPPRPKKGS